MCVLHRRRGCGRDGRDLLEGGEGLVYGFKLVVDLGRQGRDFSYRVRAAFKCVRCNLNRISEWWVGGKRGCESGGVRAARFFESREIEVADRPQKCCP